MSTMERHLCLNLAEMKDVDKARFLDISISQAGLFGDTVEGFAQQFSAVQQQTEAIQHILPRCDALSTAAPGARPQSAHRRGCPPASSRAAPPQAESTPRPARRASCRRAAPPCPSQAPSHPGSRRSGPDAGNPEMLEFALRRRREQRRSFPRWRAGRRILCFVLFFSAAGPRAIYVSSQESMVRGRCTSGQSRLGPREFGEDASERTAFCTIHPYSLSLYQHWYVDCAVGATCTVSGGVAHTAQPVSLAHAHNSTRLRDSVCQMTSQVQRRSRDVGGSPK